VIGNVPYESAGSGLIVDAAGHLVTNHHLVTGASSFLVSRFQRGNEHLPARLISTDPLSDLALLKIDAPGPFPAAEFADSSKVEVGDWVLAVGNPFGFGHTVTAGIISARRARINVGGLLYQGLLQTDAPINQGSSGGPLCNLSGQVVGINTAIYAPTGVWSGAGFAIPANRVTSFLSARMPAATPGPPAIVAATPPTPEGVRPWLGVTAIDLTPELAARLSLPGGSGAFVTSVRADSPAEAAEIQRGDVITAVAGRPVNGAGGLRVLLAGLMPGQAVPLTVWRGGLERSLTLSVSAAPGR
jgi:serine protease Do